MIERDIKVFILRALLAAKGVPLPSDTLTGSISAAFPHVAMTAADLRNYVAECEAAGWIAGTNDELLGIVWALTPKGKIRAQQL